ncbi:MAG: hypothetical protein AAAB35_26350 [Phyllobacterium sp.]|uniref:hypothetical protein n=1 Tax=Phyllobacterium sp. TaxID=1871046 RepID=UPI0030F22E21
MTRTPNKSRQQAELAFGKVQSQFLARERAFEELNSAVQARDEKTLRLRQARLAKEFADRTSATAALILKRATKV